MGQHNDLLTEAQSLFEYSRGLRRDFHMHPELGFQELRTANIISHELASLDLEVKTGVGRTGVVGLLEGKGPGPVVLVRFDMDALPIQEETEAEYASRRPGVMHACAHDGHVAIGLTVARIIHQEREKFSGLVKFVFQPAEEGLGGARSMIADGVLIDPQPDIVLSMHIWNEKPVGWIGIVPGPVMSAADTFSIKIIGKGGHGGVPNLCADPILAASQSINMLQSIVARNVSPLKSAVVTVASIHGGDAFNVIPGAVIFNGTIRTFEPSIRELVIDKIHQIVENSSRALGCESEIDIKSITPAVINDARITARVKQVAEALFAKEVIDSTTITMGSEDMAYMMQDIPGCYLFIGSANQEKGLDASHHHPKFDFDESILPKAAGLMSAAIMEFLRGGL